MMGLMAHWAHSDPGLRDPDPEDMRTRLLLRRKEGEAAEESRMKRKMGRTAGEGCSGRQQGEEESRRKVGGRRSRDDARRMARRGGGVQGEKEEEESMRRRGVRSQEEQVEGAAGG